jgi:DNA-binding HxlR family transcriptional regulator
MHLREAPAPIDHAADAPISAFCPRFQYTIELLGRRWVGAILRALASEPRRFNEILGAVPGLSDRLLTERLRELEREKLVARTVHDARPIRVSYALTCSGATLIPVLQEIAAWGERWVEIPPDWQPAGD